MRERRVRAATTQVPLRAERTLQRYTTIVCTGAPIVCSYRVPKPVAVVGATFLLLVDVGATEERERRDVGNDLGFLGFG